MGVDVEILKAKLRLHKITQARMANLIGISRDAFMRRLRKEQDFQLKEVHSMMEAIPLTMQEVEEIFFSSKK